MTPGIGSCDCVTVVHQELCAGLRINRTNVKVDLVCNSAARCVAVGGHVLYHCRYVARQNHLVHMEHRQNAAALEPWYNHPTSGAWYNATMLKSEQTEESTTAEYTPDGFRDRHDGTQRTGRCLQHVQSTGEWRHLLSCTSGRR